MQFINCSEVISEQKAGSSQKFLRIDPGRDESSGKAFRDTCDK